MCGLNHSGFFYIKRARCCCQTCNLFLEKQIVGCGPGDQQTTLQDNPRSTNEITYIFVGWIGNV